MGYVLTGRAMDIFTSEQGLCYILGYLARPGRIKYIEAVSYTHLLKNALEYIQNPDKTEECILVGGINCLPDTAFEQMEETKNIFHKTGKRQGYHVIISFSPEEKVTAEQAMYVLEHFAKEDVYKRQGYMSLLNTDQKREKEHLAQMLTIARDYAPVSYTHLFCSSSFFRFFSSGVISMVEI